MAAERKKRLTVGQRATIVSRLLEGERASLLAIEYGVSQPAISKIKKNKENILASKRILEEQQGSIAKKKCTGIEDSASEKGLYKWYVQKRSLGHAVSGTMLQEKALLYNTMTGGSADFKASSGWLNRFRKRHSIREFVTQTEISPFDECSSKEFTEEFANFVTANGINPEHIYNADETSLAWKMIPNKTIVAELESEMNGHKIQDERMTLMACSNANGSHKIPLLVIGETKKPRGLEKISSLPVVYKSQQNAWMDRDLFAIWYSEIFLPALRKKHGSDAKCILLIDNAPPHPPAEILNGKSTMCTIHFFPPAVTCLIQPIHVIVGNLKSIYKKNLLRNLVPKSDLRGTVEFLKSWNIVDCCEALARGWQSLSDINIKNSWKNILQVPEIAWYDNHFLEPYTLHQLLKQLPNGDETTTEETRKWLLEEETDSGWQILSDGEILFGSEDDNDEPEIISIDESSSIVDCSIRPEEALQGIETFKQWYQGRSECSREQLILLIKFRELAAEEVLSKKLKLDVSSK